MTTFVIPFYSINVTVTNGTKEKEREELTIMKHKRLKT